MSDLSLVVIWNNDFTINSNYHMVDIESSVYEWVGINGIKDVLCDMNGNQVPIIELNRYLQ